VRSKKCEDEVRSEKCVKWYVKCEVRSVKCECEVWSEKCVK